MANTCLLSLVSSPSLPPMTADTRMWSSLVPGGMPRIVNWGLLPEVGRLNSRSPALNLRDRQPCPGNAPAHSW